MKTQDEINLALLNLIEQFVSRQKQEDFNRHGVVTNNTKKLLQDVYQLRDELNPVPPKAVETYTTPPFTLLYPYLSKRDFRGKYSITALFEKDQDLTDMLETIKKCALEKWGELTLMPNPFHHPLKDCALVGESLGDEIRKERYPKLVDGCLLFNASTAYRPRVFDVDGNEVDSLPEGTKATAVIRMIPFEAKAWHKGGVLFELVSVRAIKEGDL